MRALRILLIDDDGADRVAISRALSRCQFSVDVTEKDSGRAGLLAFASEHFDCVLLDNRLPDMEGTDVLRELRSGTRRDSAIIMLTGEGDETIAASVMKGGAKDYLTKKQATTPALERSIVNAMEKLGRKWVTSPSNNTGRARRSVDAETTRHDDWVGETESTDMVDRLRKYYGDEVSAVLRYCSTPEGRQPVGSDESILAGQVTYSVRDEMAQCLADVVFRRTDLGTFSYPGRRALVQCAELMAGELAWTNNKVSAEIDTVEEAYSALVVAGCMELPRHSHAAIPDFAANVTAPTGES